MDCTPAPAAASAPSGGGSAAAEEPEAPESIAEGLAEILEEHEIDAQDVAQILLAPDRVTKLIDNTLEDKFKGKKNHAARLAATANNEESAGFQAVLSMMMGPRAPDAEEIEKSLADVFGNYNEAAGR